MMTEEAKAAHAAYKREWRKRNKEKVKAANERYWERKAAEQTNGKDGEHN